MSIVETFVWLKGIARFEVELLPRDASLHTVSYDYMTGVFSLCANTSNPVTALFRINVSGRLFLVRTENLNMFPQTLLGSPAKEKFWRDDLNAYYFDRNREFFVSVQQFYQLKGAFSRQSCNIK